MAANIGAIVALIGDKNEAAARLLDKQEFTANQLQSMKPEPLQDVLIQHGKMSAGAAMRAVERVHPGSIATSSSNDGPQKRKASDSGSTSPTATKPKHGDAYAADASAADASAADASAAAVSTPSESVIAVVLDRSGSMSHIHASVVSGYNELLAEHKANKNGGDVFWFVTQFDGTVDVLHRGTNLEDVPKATMTDFEPRGSTALYDAVGATIIEMKKFLKSRPADPNRFVTCTVFTDGQDNSSMPASKTAVAAEIKRLQDEKNWKFMFVGANQDAIVAGASLNVPENMSLTFTANPDKCGAAFRAVSATQSALRRQITEDQTAVNTNDNGENDSEQPDVLPPPLLGFTKLMRAQTQDFY